MTAAMSLTITANQLPSLIIIIETDSELGPFGSWFVQNYQNKTLIASIT
jgi:hypothetical protein